MVGSFLFFIIKIKVLSIFSSCNSSVIYGVGGRDVYSRAGGIGVLLFCWFC